MSESPLEPGWIDAELAEEFPDLALWTVRVDGRAARSPASVREHLRSLADRVNGGFVVHMRQDPVPWAYRVFWRQVGLDPDHDRTPVEALAVQRLRDGGLRSRDLVHDALVIATLETSVPLLAFDAERVGSQLGLRLARAGEELAVEAPLRTRQIVVADEDRPVALVSGEVAAEHGVSGTTRKVVLAAVQVKGVPRISIEEALWAIEDTVAVGG